MLLLPAIDIMNGKCVRLYRGRFEQVTTYNEYPLDMARFFVKEGADFLHIVDLDGAREGEIKNFKTIHQICKAISIPIEVGGGIRHKKDIAKILDAGVSRVILGTAAVEDLKWLKKVLQKFDAKKIVIGLDVHGDKVATHGWEKASEIDVFDFAKELEDLGVKRIIYTDISRDGTLTSPNFELGEKLIQLTDLKIIASGGVTTFKHLEILRDMGIEGAIIGKALYEGKINLAEVKKKLEKK